MPEFHLDTSGRVECAGPAKPCVCHAATWAQLDAYLGDDGKVYLS